VLLERLEPMLTQVGRYYAAEGTWSLSADSAAVTTTGGWEGQGRLPGGLFADEELTAPQDSALCLRCRDAWSSLADNAGSLTVKFQWAD